MLGLRFRFLASVASLLILSSSGCRDGTSRPGTSSTDPNSPNAKAPQPVADDSSKSQSAPTVKTSASLQKQVDPPRNSPPPTVSQTPPVTPDQAVKTFENFYPGGAPRVQYQYKLGPDGKEIKHGHFVSFHKNGQVLLEGDYTDGLRHGIWSSWWENGKLRGKCEYVNGGEDGLWTKWDENETKRIEYHAVLGSKQGRWTEWDEKGRVVEEGDYKDDQKIGVWKKYAPDGTVTETRWDAGKPVG